MNFSGVSTAVRELATFLPLLGGMALIAAVFFVTYRTGSGRAVLRRVWRLVHGKDAVSDADVRRFVGERSDLMAFRFESNLRVRTIGQARRLAGWLKDNDEDVLDVQRCRRYFDLENCQLETPLPDKALTAFLVVSMMALAIPAVFMPYIIANDKVLLSLKESGTQFLVSPDADKAWPWPPELSFGQPEPLFIETCRSNADAPSTPTPFSAVDTEVICDLLESPDSSAYLSTALLQQRVAATVLLFVLAVLVYLPFRALMTIQAARQMSERLEGRSRQLKFHFGE